MNFGFDDLAGTYTAGKQSFYGDKQQEASALLVVAEGHLNHEEEDEAMKAAASALELFRELKDLVGIADAIRLHVYGWNYQRKFKESLKIVKDEMPVFEKASDRQGVAKMTLALSEIYSEQQLPVKQKDALKLAKEALAVFREFNNHKMIGRALLQLISMHVKTDEGAPLAIEMSKEALEHFREEKDKRGEASALHALAAGYTIHKEYEKAFKTSAEALDLIQELGIKKWEAFELNSIAHWHIYAGNPKRALPLAMEALEIFQETKSHPGKEAMAYNRIFQARLAIARRSENWQAAYDEALDVAKEALARFQELKYQDGECSALNMMIELHQDTGELEEASRYCDLFLDIVREQEDWNNEAKCMVMAAQIFVERDLFQKGVQLAMGALKIYQEQVSNCGPMQIADTMCTVAQVYQRKGDFKLAVSKATEAQSIVNESGDVKSEVEILQMIAQLHMQAGEYKAVLRVSAEARELCEDNNLEDFMADTLLTSAQAHIYVVTRGARYVAPGSNKWNESLEKALRSAKESAALASLSKTQGMEPLRATALATMAEALSLSGRHQECVEASNEAVMLWRELGDEDSEGNSLMISARAYFEIGRNEDARPAAEEAKELYQFTNNAQGEHEATELLEKIAPPVMIQQNQWLMQQAMPAAAQVPMGGAIPFQPQQQQQMMPGGGGSIMQRQAGAALDVSGGLKTDIVLPKVREVAMSLIGDNAEEDLENESPLMNVGLTSNTAILLADALSQEIPGVRLQPTLVFDYPTVAEIADYIVESGK